MYFSPCFLATQTTNSRKKMKFIQEIEAINYMSWTELSLGFVQLIAYQSKKMPTSVFLDRLGLRLPIVVFRLDVNFFHLSFQKNRHPTPQIKNQA
jgi:hypothetical protein